MKKLVVIIALLVFGFAFGQKQVLPPRPNPPKLVNILVKDPSSIMTPEQIHALEAKLVAYDDSTSNQITIVVLPTLHDYEAAPFATELGETWGVGGAKFDNGIVILVSTGEEEEGRRKAFIAIGRGLEGAIPDMTAGYIYDELLVPEMRAGNFYSAFDKSTSALIQAAQGEYAAPEGYRDKKGKGGFSLGKIIVGIILFLVIMFFNSGGGGRGGGYMSRRGYRGFGGPVIFPGSFGGSSGGGFGGGGGGFGGFGGGSFGGGGAGGSW